MSWRGKSVIVRKREIAHLRCACELAKQSQNLVRKERLLPPHHTSDMLRPLHDPDLLLRQPIQLIHQAVDLGIG